MKTSKLPTMAEIRAANAVFFSPDSERFFGTKKWTQNGFVISAEATAHPAGRGHYIHHYADPVCGLKLRALTQFRNGWRVLVDHGNGVQQLLIDIGTGMPIGEPETLETE